MVSEAVIFFFTYYISGLFIQTYIVLIIVDRLRESIRAHLNDNRVGEILRDGIHITISGPPNAGKSSFLNTLGECDVMTLQAA
jgi:tRNA modification GTPase